MSVFLLPSPTTAQTIVPGRAANILILNSYHHGYLWSEKEIEGLESKLKPEFPRMNLSLEYLDTKRFPDPRHLSLAKDNLTNKYGDTDLDLVIALDNPALDLLLTYRDVLFKNVPVVFAGINNFTPEMLRGRKGITGVAEVLDIRGTLRTALALHPNCREVFVMHDYTASGLAIRKEMEAHLTEFERRCRITFNPPATFEENVERMKRLPPGSVGLILAFTTDRAGRSFPPGPKSIRLLTSVDSVPVYALHETPLGQGIVGGMLLNGTDQGVKAGEIALRILRGEDPDRIQVVTTSTSRPMFDYRQLERFKISINSLPPGSLIINRPVSFFEKNKPLIIAALFVIGALTSVILALIANIAGRRRTEKALLNSETRLKAMINSSQDPILTISPDRVILSVNPAFENLYGYRPEESVGHTVAFLHADEKAFQRFGEKIYPIIVKEGFWTGEWEFRSRDGRIIPIELTMSDLQLPDGKKLGFLAIHRDFSQRKIAEDELKSLSRLNRGILDSLRAHICLIDETGMILAVNQAWIDFAAANPPVGKQVEPGSNYLAVCEAALEEDAVTAQKMIRGIHAVTEGDLEEFTLEYPCHSPFEKRWFLARASRFVSEGPSRIVISHVNITEQKQVETALRASEEKFRELIENMHEGVWVIDADAVTTFVNPRMAQMLGYTKEEMIGRHLFDFMDGAGRCLAEKNLERRRQGIREQHDFEFTRKDGTRLFALVETAPLHDDQGNHTGSIAAIADISDRRSMQLALEERESNYRLLFENLSAGFALHAIILDDAGRPADYRFLEVNPAFEALTGLKAGTIVGRSVLEVIPVTEPYWIETYGRVALTGKAEYFENFSQPLDQWFEVRAYSPQTGQFAVIFSDITERKNTELKLQRSLKEKEVMLKEIHHRVKNNLQVISSLLNLQARFARDAQAVEVLRESQNRLRTMAFIHAKLYQAPDLASVNWAEYLSDLVGDLIRSYNFTAANIDLKIVADQVKLDLETAVPCGLIINELVSNALKYAFPDQDSWLPEPFDRKEIIVQMHPKEKTMVLIVSDNGIGLPPGLDFRQTESLGLQLVVTLTEQLSGSIRQLEGPGTGFEITFPIGG